MSAQRKLANDDRYPIPAKVLQQNIITLGKTGAGKSSALRAVIEPMLDDAMPVCIIDPKGDWWGLKLAADGKRPGYPLVIFGGKHADVPLNERAGAHVAELFASGNRPCIIDLRGWMPAERSRFFVDFASTLYKHNVGRKWLVIDECHNFTPKGKVLDVESGKCLHWASKLASEGRGLGITLIGASQRPQKVHNDFLTSCETLIAMRVLHASDRVAYKEWIDGCGDPERGKEMLATIANLKRGTGYVWSPEIEFGPELVKFPMFSTYDSFKPQEASDVARLSGWAEVDLEDTKAKLATVIEEHKANDPAELKKQIRDRDYRIEKLEEQLSQVGDQVSDEELRRASEKARREGVAAGVKAASAAIAGKVAGVVQAGDELVARIRAIADEAENPPREWHEINFDDMPPIPTTRVRAPAVREPAPRRVEPAPRADAGGGAPRRILTALAENREGLTARKLSILADIKKGGSTWRGAMAGLRRDQHIEDNGEIFKITPAGRSTLGTYEPLPTGKALREYWRAKMGGTRRQIFDAIVGAGGHPVPAHRVAAAANVELGGSTWRGHMAYLRGLELVSGSNELSACEDLF